MIVPSLGLPSLLVRVVLVCGGAGVGGKSGDEWSVGGWTHHLMSSWHTWFSRLGSPLLF